MYITLPFGYRFVLRPGRAYWNQIIIWRLPFGMAITHGDD